MFEQLSNTRYKLSGALTMRQGIETLLDIIKKLQSSPEALNQFQLDMSEVTEADSVLLASIIDIARAVEARQGVFQITGFPQHLRSLAKTYGIDVLIEHYMVYHTSTANT